MEFQVEVESNIFYEGTCNFNTHNSIYQLLFCKSAHFLLLIVASIQTKITTDLSPPHHTNQMTSGGWIRDIMPEYS